MISILKKIDSKIHTFTYVLLTIVIVNIAVFSVLSITFRWIGMTITWVDPLLRHLVFYSAFLGATLATGMENHIKIDIVPIFLKKMNKENLNDILFRFISFISFLIIVWLGFASYEMFLMEMEFGKEEFLGIHSSHLIVGVILGFTLLGCRFLIKAVIGSTKQ
ncbi:TRAP transporter small permease subunit [Bacteriovoracaceae bacterium]|nr:TRAP transporter small permease subunit [Bacteriovoracaceae bacterium]